MVFAADLIIELKNILLGVSNEPSLLWQIAPLVALWFILEIYFGKYKKEKLGWNTALANGITMFWIVLSALQFVFSNQRTMRVSWGIFIILFVIALYAITIITVSFKHSLKSHLAYFIASPTPVYYFSIISLLVAHQIVAVDLASIIAIIWMFLFFILLFFVIRLVVPKGESSVDDTLDTDFDFDKPKKKKRKSKKKDDLFSTPSPLENELDSTFSSKTDPFSNDFASTAKENDLLMKHNPPNSGF